MNLDGKIVYLLLGSNLGNSRKIIDEAIVMIDKRAGKLSAQSSYYRTAAWGKTDQPDFLNVAIAINTQLMPAELLKELLAIERELGRTRDEKWSARLIDIDIIFYDNQTIDTPVLKIPHPQMQHRKFVLVPLAEIAQSYVHPKLKKNIADLLLTLNDDLMVNPVAD